LSLVGFSARNHPQQAVRDAVDDRGTLPRLSTTRSTPEHRFTLDAAASGRQRELSERYFTRHTDGLLRSWAGERVWCNPPYSRLDAVAREGVGRRCAAAASSSSCCSRRTAREQRCWQDCVEPYRDGDGRRTAFALRTCQFLRGRTRFVMPPGFQYYTTKAKGDRPPFGCVLLTWERPGAVGA
jgi:hypothetical protein